MFSLSPPPQRKCRVAALTSVFVIVVTGESLITGKKNDRNFFRNYNLDIYLWRKHNNSTLYVLCI